MVLDSDVVREKFSAFYDMKMENESDLKNALNNFCDLVKFTTESVFDYNDHDEKKRQYYKEGFSHKDWFDERCKVARKILRRKIRLHGKNCKIVRNAQKAFEFAKKKARNKFLYKKCEEFKDLETKSAKNHWKLFKSGFNKRKMSDKICLEDWFQHFKNLLGGDVSQNNNGEEDSIEQEMEDEKLYIPVLDGNISLSELRVCMLYFMKYNTACGLDEVYNNVLKWGVDWFAPILLNIFHLALALEITPED